MLIRSLNGRLRPGRRCFNPPRTSHTGESASYKTRSVTNGSSTPHPSTATKRDKRLGKLSTINSSESILSTWLLEREGRGIPGRAEYEAMVFIGFDNMIDR